jgi:hypothetical protein
MVKEMTLKTIKEAIEILNSNPKKDLNDLAKKYGFNLDDGDKMILPLKYKGMFKEHPNIGFSDLTEKIILMKNIWSNKTLNINNQEDPSKYHIAWRRTFGLRR